MINNQKDKKTGTNMSLPRSVIFNSLKDAIETKEESRIGELADIMHSSMQYHLLHSSEISDNSARIDLQHQEIKNTLETMREGFRQIDKRFEQVDKRFEEQNEKFRNQNWLIGAGFFLINTMMVMLKIFG